MVLGVALLVGVDDGVRLAEGEEVGVLLDPDVGSVVALGVDDGVRVGVGSSVGVGSADFEAVGAGVLLTGVVATSAGLTNR